jgi:hypothetical protein
MSGQIIQPYRNIVKMLILLLFAVANSRRVPVLAHLGVRGISLNTGFFNAQARLRKHLDCPRRYIFLSDLSADG